MSTTTIAPISAADADELRGLVQAIAAGAEAVRSFDADTGERRALLESVQRAAQELCAAATLNDAQSVQAFVLARARAEILAVILGRGPTHRAALMSAFIDDVKLLGNRIRQLTGIARRFDCENLALSPLDAAELAAREIERLLAGESDERDGLALAAQRRRAGA